MNNRRGDVETIRTMVENGVDCSIGDYDKRTVTLLFYEIKNNFGIHFLHNYGMLPVCCLFGDKIEIKL